MYTDYCYCIHQNLVVLSVNDTFIIDTQWCLLEYLSMSAESQFKFTLCRCSLESCQNKLGILVMATLYKVYSVQQYRVISQPRSLKLRFVNQLLKLLFIFIIKHIMCIVLVCLINLCLAL